MENVRCKMESIDGKWLMESEDRYKIR